MSRFQKDLDDLDREHAKLASWGGVPDVVTSAGRDVPTLPVMPVRRDPPARGRGMFDSRDSYMPAALRGTPPTQQPPGTDLDVWTYESAGALYAIAFAGKAIKPLWHHRFRNEQARQEYIDTTAEQRHAKQERRGVEKASRTAYRHNLKVGDVLVSTWGYDQTNVDFYEVVAAREKSVKIRPIGSRSAGGATGVDYVMPAPGSYTGEASGWKPVREGGYVHLTSYSSASRWSGQKMSATASGWGH